MITIAGLRPPGKQLSGHRHHRQGTHPCKRKIEAAYQAAGRPIDNVKIMSTDIERIKGVITPVDEVSRIYINFYNPWSKNDSSNLMNNKADVTLGDYIGMTKRKNSYGYGYGKKYGYGYGYGYGFQKNEK